MRRVITLELMLFLGLWIFYGLLINTKNIDDFGQSVTEAIVDKRRLSVEDLKAWPVRGDVFHFEGHTYSNKNPGQAIISSIAYAHLKLLGVSYEKDKMFAGALVIFFSSSLLTALAAVALFLLARDLLGSRSTLWPLGAALIWALCTTQTAFSGVAWHDVQAASMLVCAVYLLQKIRIAELSPQTERNLSLAAGALLGMVITLSMTFFFMVVVFGLYFLTLRKWELLKPFILGGIAGIAPLLAYNVVCFGNPFSFPAVLYFAHSGHPPDVYFYLDWNNFTSKAEAYYQQIIWYAPVLWFGAAGLFFLPSQVRREQLFIFAAVLVLLIYMFNVQGFGVCGYGPRYLMPIMPFLALGIIGLGRIPTRVLKLLMGAVIFYYAVLSLRINVLGAIGGAMFCNFAAYAYPDYSGRLFKGLLTEFPLFGLLLPFFLAWCVWAIYSQTRSGDRQRSPDLARQ